MDSSFSDITALLARYYDGLFHCDIAKLKTVFHPEAHYYTASFGGLTHYNMTDYMKVIEERTSPSDLGEDHAFAIDAVTFAGPDTALAQLRCSMLGKSYVDFLSLIFIGGEWRIIAKVFHAEPLLISTPANGDE